MIDDPAFSETFLVALGRRLRIARWNADGARGSLPLLVLNGIGMNLDLIDPLARALAPREVISFDMPGIGKSPDPLLPYNAVTIAMTASIVLDRLGVERADVLGISWGGWVAQQFALQHRGRVGRLVLASTTAGAAMAPGAAPALARVSDPAEFTIGKAMQRSLALLYNGGGKGIPVSLNAALPPSPTGWAYQVLAFAGWSVAPLLPFLDVPTLVIAGNEDQVVPPLNARLLHALIPGSRLRPIEGGGHLAMLSHLAEFATALREFLVEEVALESV